MTTVDSENLVGVEGDTAYCISCYRPCRFCGGVILGDVEDEENGYKFEVRSGVCNVKSDKTHLSAIFNGYPGDLIEMRTFMGFILDEWECIV